MTKQEIQQRIEQNKADIERLSEEGNKLQKQLEEASQEKRYYIGSTYKTTYGEIYLLIPGSTKSNNVLDCVTLLSMGIHMDTKCGFYRATFKRDKSGYYINGLPTFYPKDFGPDEVSLLRKDVIL
jgi:hypothetical protein